MAIRHYSTTTRNEIDVQLLVKEGTIPDDMCGFIYINSASGSVNSGGLPFPELNGDGTPNQEYASPLLNGDGMVYKIDLSRPGIVHVKTGMMKAPCFYADLATTYDSKENNPYYPLHFNSSGLARLSMVLGVRNQLNTAITPVRFSKDQEYRLLANFDAARPFEFNPEDFSIITAIGENKMWHSGLPPVLFQPFPMVLTSAHPVFDPRTEELFTVNFTKDIKCMMKSTTIMRLLFKDMDWLGRELKILIKDLLGLGKSEQRARLKKFLDTAHLKAPSSKKSWFDKLLDRLRHVFDRWFFKNISNRDEIHVTRWDGSSILYTWRVVGPGNKGILIQHNMHQIALSRDYLILGDTNFKFTLDGMFDFPFQHFPDVDEFCRNLLTGPMNDYSSLYIIKRTDLIPGNLTVKAVKATLPKETVHFSANYNNPNNIITIHTAHNCSACPAEWIRPYDKPKLNIDQPIDKEFLGLISIGEMDIGKIGKVVINADTGDVLEPESVFLGLPGNLDNEDPGPHTWGLGLYTYDNMLSPDTNMEQIDYIYWQAYGLDKRLLTEFIYDLYKDPKRNRTYTAEEMEAFTAKGAPFVLQCIETETMKAIDHYSFPKEHSFWSLQFSPKRNKSESVPDGQNGYIFTTVICGEPLGNGETTYNAEIWVFDAANLQGGPVCKLYHPEMSFGFTIHSVWVAQAGNVSKPDYIVNVKEDYDYMISQMQDEKNKILVQQLFDEKVYPNFPDLL